ncbi:MAG: hypothetical protein ABIZ04_06270 [Opitutus sp.]
MKLKTAILSLAFTSFASFASAALIGFDDLTTPAVGGTSVPDGYAGYNWTYTYYVDANNNNFGSGAPNSVGSGYHDGVVSQPNVAFWGQDDIAKPVIITATGGGLFDLGSVSLNAAYLEDLTIRVRGYRNGVVKYDTTVVVDPYTPTPFAFNYLGIDALRFDASGGTVGAYGDHGTFFVMDNITLTASADTDGDGVFDFEDHCIHSVLGGKVNVGNGLTSINNVLVAEGCSIQDLVNELASAAADHGSYVDSISSLADRLRASALITKQQANEMKQSAAKSKVGK